MRKIFSLGLLLLALAGCAGGGSISPLSSAPPQIDSRGTAAVIATTTVPGAENIATALQQEVAGQILSKRVFSDVQAAATAADIRIECLITQANDVTQATRVMVGALAGRALVTANVKIVDSKTEAVLGEFVATGRSSGGNIFAGTTKEAVQETAKQITDYLLRNRRI
jgi:hypothetical protein